MPLERVSQGFKDISMTFQRNPLNDDILTLKNERAIARSVRNIVFTIPGEKPFDETFGSRITASLFENIDDLTGETIKDEIEYSINRFEPRVNLLNVDVDAEEDFNRFKVSIEFQMITNLQRGTTEFFLERIR